MRMAQEQAILQAPAQFDEMIDLVRQASTTSGGMDRVERDLWDRWLAGPRLEDVGGGDFQLAIVTPPLKKVGHPPCCCPGESGPCTRKDNLTYSESDIYYR